MNALERWVVAPKKGNQSHNFYGEFFPSLLPTAGAIFHSYTQRRFLNPRSTNLGVVQEVGSPLGSHQLLLYFGQMAAFTSCLRLQKEGGRELACCRQPPLLCHRSVEAVAGALSGCGQRVSAAGANQRNFTGAAVASLGLMWHLQKFAVRATGQNYADDSV